MKRYIQYFKWFFIAVAVGLVVTIIMLVLNSRNGDGNSGRTNTSTLTTERVFDIGEVLSPEEEERLRVLIAKNEQRTGCDIVLVILNESLEGYVADKGVSVPVNEYVKVYAEDFYDEQLFGYNVPDGDGIILVDNWFRESDGTAYTWISAAGKAVPYYDYENTEHMLDQIYEYIETDPYRAYEAYIKQFLKDMTGPDISLWFAPLAALICAVLFVLIHLAKRQGARTTMANTYVNGGEPLMNKKEDILLDKKVVSRVIETPKSSGSSGSGGGGGGGGHSGGGRGR